MAVYILEIGLFFTLETTKLSKKNLTINGIILIIMLIIPNNTIKNFYYGLFSQSEQEYRKMEYSLAEERLDLAKNLQEILTDDSAQIVLDNADIVSVSMWNYLLYPSKVRLWGSIDGIWDSDEYLILSSKFRNLKELTEFDEYFEEALTDGGIYKILRQNNKYKMQIIGKISLK